MGFCIIIMFSHCFPIVFPLVFPLKLQFFQWVRKLLCRSSQEAVAEAPGWTWLDLIGIFCSQPIRSGAINGIPSGYVKIAIENGHL